MSKLSPCLLSRVINHLCRLFSLSRFIATRAQKSPECVVINTDTAMYLFSNKRFRFRSSNTHPQSAAVCFAHILHIAIRLVQRLLQSVRDPRVRHRRIHSAGSIRVQLKRTRVRQRREEKRERMKRGGEERTGGPYRSVQIPIEINSRTLGCPLSLSHRSRREHSLEH